MNKKKLNYLILGLYLISLFTKSFTGGGGVHGILTLIYGGFSILIGNLFAFGAWSANILFFISLIRKIKLKTKLILSGIAVLLGTLALFVTELPMHMGSSTSFVKIGIGFYFWIGSFILLFMKNLMEYFKLNKEHQST